jgi:hypothetical protein
MTFLEAVYKKWVSHVMATLLEKTSIDVIDDF